jgi:hypothetical protein
MIDDGTSPARPPGHLTVAALDPDRSPPPAATARHYAAIMEARTPVRSCW